MLKKISEWFAIQLTIVPEEEVAHTVELATAVLLLEIMRADNQLQEQETEVFFTRLKTLFSLSDNELQTLHTLSTEQADQAADFVQFTRVINEQCSNQDKRKILDSLWHIAISDGVVDPHEEHLIRRIADLMHMPHSQFIQSKLSVSDSSA